MIKLAKNKKKKENKEGIIKRYRIVFSGYGEGKSMVSVAVYFILRVLVVLVMVVQMYRENYFDVFLCVLTLVLFMIPAFADRRLNIEVPSALEIIILLFIFSAEILGEINNFYGIFHNWDTMLHTINGFMMAAIGFALIDILNNNPKFHFTASPIFVAFVAFCFSMTVGVVWEFFEFSADTLFNTDMQKDFIYQTISTVHEPINASGENSPVVVKDIQTVITGTVDGEYVEYVIDGYLDIGIKDTMKDLMVNCIGAIVFSIIGVFYIKGRGDFASKFMPKLKHAPKSADKDTSKHRRKDGDSTQEASLVSVAVGAETECDTTSAQSDV